MYVDSYAGFGGWDEGGGKFGVEFFFSFRNSNAQPKRTFLCVVKKFLNLTCLSKLSSKGPC